MLVTDICLSVSCQKMFLQLISANRQNTLFNYAFHKSSLFSIFFYVFSKKLLTTSVFSCIVHYVVEMQQNFIIKVVQEWRNWQTRRLQVPVVAISCGFKSHLLHYFFTQKKETDTVSFFSVLMIQKTSDNGKSSMWFHYRNEFRLLSYIPAFSDKNKDLHISHRQLLFSFWH